MESGGRGGRSPAPPFDFPAAAAFMARNSGARKRFVAGVPVAGNGEVQVVAGGGRGGRSVGAALPLVPLRKSGVALRLPPPGHPTG